ncbi:MAG: uroporphyrinogen-III C-methyltransferase [Bacteroidota bacterium]
MSYLPISLNVENKNILIIGGGNVAYQKAKNILAYAKHVTVVAPEFIVELQQMDGLNFISDVYKPEYLKDQFLVYACTDSKKVNQQISSDSEKAGVLCNRTDNADCSDFISSVILENESIIAGINSKNRNPQKTLAVKEELNRFLRERELLEKQKKELKGKVFLVGFGPGNPDLLTKKGEKLLKQADIIFYDDLLASEALDEYPGEKEYVGKRRGNHSKEQSEINEILFKAAREGHMVVRLKGGDPFIFGRGGEEKSYLEEKGIPVEVIPGITSAVGAAAFSGIPLTHRGVSSSVSFGTAHGKNSFCISETDTSVYYMGAKNLREIARKYLENNYPADYSVGIIYNVSMPDQEVIYTTISDIAEGKVTLKSPAISIFGDTVKKGKQPL